MPQNQNRQKVQAPVTLASVESLYIDRNQNRSVFDEKNINHISNGTILQDMARKEAERIIQTGDYQSLQKRIEDNKPLLKLMGYNF